MSGLILIDRSMLDHHIVGIKNPLRFAAWAWMLAKARYKQGQYFHYGHEITLEVGQFVCARKHMAEKTGMTEKQVRTFLMALERANMVTKAVHQKGQGISIITICKYKEYQDFSKYREMKGPAKGPSKGQGGARVGPHRETPEETPVYTYDDAVTREVENGIEILTPRELILVAMGHDKTGATATGRMVGNPADMLDLGRWQNDLGLSLQEVIGVIEGVMSNKNKSPPTVFRYFNNPMQQFAGQKAAPKLQPDMSANYENGNRNGYNRQSNNGASGAHAGLIAGFAANAQRYAAEDAADAAVSRSPNKASAPRLAAKEGG